ncbi:gastrokine-3-like [Dipodomys spectabilis]|uniref:gastrokine-3-like n=1 Tax=Dipodomys spectabilis TaxID=105255 RepID=UPI001C53873E|nr:gastrokine-3-like [Dipodomys spectabilis]
MSDYILAVKIVKENFSPLLDLFEGNPEAVLLMVTSILVIFFLTPSLALLNTKDSFLLDGADGTQIIQVDASRGIVSIRDNNAFSEWDGLLDYKNNLLVAKLFSKMVCVLAKMDQAIFPSLDDISRALEKKASSHYPATHGLTYTVIPSRVKNLAQYGMPIKDLCRAVPAYFAQQQKEGTALAVDPNSCFEVQLLSFMGISICGEISGL